jgi:adhesin HecA-like repeat protein
MRITSGGNVELSTGSLKTGNPSGGTASAFKVGTITNGFIAQNASVRMEINGTVVNVLIAY